MTANAEAFQLSQAEISSEIKHMNLQALAALVIAYADAGTPRERYAAFSEMFDLAQAVRDAA